jgi:hypothetical protein
MFQLSEPFQRALTCLNMRKLIMSIRLHVYAVRTLRAEYGHI